MGCKMSEVRILSSRPVRKDLLCAGFFMFDKRVQDLNLRKRRFDYKRKAGGRTPVCKKQMSALAASLRSQSSRPDQIEAFLYGKLFYTGRQIANAIWRGLLLRHINSLRILTYPCLLMCSENLQTKSTGATVDFA